MILYGASGHAKVIADVMREMSIDLTMFFDDNKLKSKFIGQKVSVYDANLYPDEEIIITIGNNIHRRNISKKISHKYGQIVHPSAAVSATTKVGNGTVILQNSSVQVDVIIGQHCIINTSASVDHECVLSDFVHVSPNTTLCGNVQIGEGTQVGAGAVVLPNIIIGKWSIIGAGAVINTNIPDNVIVVGNPGKIIKRNF